MKRLLSLMLTMIMVFGLLPAAAMAKSNQMDDGVPVWNEETVRQYALDYVEGQSMDRLWGYYDLQIRRYLPMETYEALLTELAWLTGDFIELGTYDFYVEAENKTKTHVLHLCMGKQDLDLYFTHKDKDDDWEVMAVQFIPAQEQAVSDGRDMLVGEIETNVIEAELPYTETEITIGSEPTALAGILTMPINVTTIRGIPACVLVHDFGPLDMNSTMGQTRMFSDMAHELAVMGIATVRYDKRTFTYGESEELTAKDEVIEDAILAAQLLSETPRIDKNRIVLIGHGLGGMLAPRIARDSNGLFDGMIIIGGIPDSVLVMDLRRYEKQLADSKPEEITELNTMASSLAGMSESKAKELSVLGKNGYYYWEMLQHDQIRIMKRLNIPTYIVQGRADPLITEKEGRLAYVESIGMGMSNLSFKAFRGLNHLLMNDLSTKDGEMPTYDVPASLDTQATRNLARWILRLTVSTSEE